MSAVCAFLVEDSPVLRDSLVGTLEELGHVKVMGCAEDEHSAVAWLKQNRSRCNLVVIDIFLRSGSGLGVLQSAHEIEPPLNLVVLSNWATDALRRHCMNLGASKVFDKSNEIDELIDYCARLEA